MTKKNKVDPENKINSDYVKLLELALHKKFPVKKKQDLVKILDIGSTTYHNLFNNDEGVERTVNHIARKCNFVTYDDFIKRKPILEHIKKRLTEGNGFWVSYCFNNRRRLYESTWTFREKQNPDTKDSFIEAIRDSVDFRYEGELVLNVDLSLAIKVQYADDHKLEYITVFPDEKESAFYEQFKYLNLETLAIREKQIFTTLEILVKPSSSNITPRLIEYNIIKTQMGKDKTPANDAYLAFNFLTRYVSKSQRILDNYSINQKLENGSYLNYKHNIFISCPIRYLKNEEDFISLRRSVENIVDALIDDYGFARENIYCKIIEYDNFSEIKRDYRHLFFESRELINATHHIALIPRNLDIHNSGIYMEIYFRVFRKLPAHIFIEDRTILPSLLHGLTDSPDKPINVNFKDIAIDRVADHMKEAKEYLFEFSL